jgi:DNA-binding transcriptional LysR family regulator
MKSASSAASLPNLEAFTVTFEEGSFSKAAVRLGVTPQATSRAVARLEASIGAVLFRRTTRKLEATEAGKSYYDACREALRVLVGAESRLRDRDRTKGASGLVRLSVPTTYGHHRLLPSLLLFRERHPAIELEIHLSNRSIDFVKEGYDLAIRMGDIHDASFNRIKLGAFSVGVFGSPSYLRKHGVPETPASLQSPSCAHSCISFIMPKTGRVLPWSLRPAKGEDLASFVPISPLLVSDDVLGTITLAKSGAGLVQTYHFTVQNELARGELVEVLSDYGGLSRPFSLIYARQAEKTPQRKAVRALIAHVRELGELRGVVHRATFESNP